MKVGYLERSVDVSGVSGTGSVAEFSVASDGRCTIYWAVGIGNFPSLEEAIAVHGHEGSTTFVILNDEVEDAPHCVDCHSIKQFGNVFSEAKCVTHDFGCPSCLSQVG